MLYLFINYFITFLSNMTSPNLTMTFSLIVAIASTLDLILSFSEKARNHSDLARQFITLEKIIIQIPEEQITEEHIRKYTTNRVDIELNEPPKISTLDVICHYELAKAMGYENAEYELVFFQRLLANFVDIRTDFKLKTVKA